MNTNFIHARFYNKDHYRAEEVSPASNRSLSTDYSQSPIQLVSRYYARIFVFSIFLTAFAALVIWNIPPIYTASASATIDARQVQVIGSEQLVSSQKIDEPQVRTFMEGLLTPVIAKTVVSKLGLNKVREFCWEAKHFSDWWNHFVNRESAFVQTPCETERAAEQLRKSISVTNDGKSYVIRIEASAENGALAAAIANTYAETYVEDRLAKRRKITEDAASWLNDYVSKLSGQVMAADAAVAQYRAAHDLTPFRGETLVSQSVQDLNSQLSALNNEIAKKQSVLSQLGPNWQGGLSKEVAALNARKDIMASQLQNFQSRVGQQGDQDVQLQELLRNADSSRQIYEAALTRLKEIQIDEGIARSDAQLASEATIPPFPSYPHKTMMLVGSFLASLGLGTGLTFLISLHPRLFRDARHLESETGVPLLGVFPRPPHSCRPERISIEHPLSLEAESLHKVLINLLVTSASLEEDLGKVLLITSAIPGEGKSSYSIALGRSARQIGLSTVLVDCDMWNPTIEAKLQGLQTTESASDFVKMEIGNRFLLDQESGLCVIPLSAVNNSSPYIQLASQAMKDALKALQKKYDLIILDTPPLFARTDALALTSLARHVILLAGQHTSRVVVHEALNMLRQQGAPISGIVFSKVDLRNMVNGAYSYFKRYNKISQKS